MVVAVAECDCGICVGIGVGTSASDCCEEVGAVVCVFVLEAVVLGTEQITVFIVGVGKCVVAINPLFGFSPVEVVVGIVNDASVAVASLGEVVESVVCGETIPLGGGFDAESSDDVVGIAGGVVG